MRNHGSPRSYALKLAFTEKSIPDYQNVIFLTSINSQVLQQETGYNAREFATIYNGVKLVANNFVFPLNT